MRRRTLSRSTPIPMSLRVAHFLPHYPGREGSTAYCRGLCGAMNRRWAGSAPIITLRTDGRPGTADDELLRYPHRPRHPFSLPRPLRRDLEENRHGLKGVVLHGTFNPPMASVARWLRASDIPYIFLPHDPYVPELMRHNRWRKAVYWHVFEKPLIEGARAVQLLDESHEAPLRRRGCRVPVFTVPNGCDPAMLEDLVGPERVPGADPQVKIQYLGRMDRNHKGLDLLIEGFAAFAASADCPAGTRLVLSGNDWTDRGWLEDLAGRRGIAGRVDFTGPRPEPSLRIHAAADLVVLPSRFDGFGLTVVEAMLAARPVLVSRGAGVAGQVAAAGGGWVVEPTAEGIGQGLRDAFAARAQWPELGRRNRRHVLEHLTWDDAAVRSQEAYERYFH